MRFGKLVLWTLAAFLLMTATWSGAQSTDASSTTQAAIPRLIKFNGVLRDLSGKPLSGPVDVTFSLYSQESGGSALWFETQTVQADALGNYTVLLGAMTPTGVPMELFTSGEAHWLGVQVSNLPEQSRVLLVSVPYAMKAGDAETLGGKPASDYVLSSQAATDSTTSTTSTTSLTTLITSGATKTATTTSEAPVTNAFTTNYIPVYSDNLGNTTNSIMVQSGTKIGINTNAPAFNLDLNGAAFAIGPKTAAPGAGGTMRFRDDTGTQRWLFGLPGTAGSQDFQMYNYTNGHAPIFIQNGAYSYSLYLSGNGNVGIGTTNPGQKLSVNGTIESTTGGFRFPDGTTQTSAATGTGGPTTFAQISGTVGSTQLSGTYTNAVAFSNASNSFTGDGSGLTNVGSSSTVILGATATFTGDVSTSSNLDLPATNGAGTAGVINLGGNPFIHTCCANSLYNTFLGQGAGSFTADATGPNFGTGENTGVGFLALNKLTSGFLNTATGFHALYANTTGHNNNASGASALHSNTTGNNNTASGFGALSDVCSGVGSCTANNNTAVGYASGGTITSGSSNTFLGASTNASSESLTNATAIGANAHVGESNALVLGSINGVNGATSSVNVGIGTATPAYPLSVSGTGNQIYSVFSENGTDSVNNLKIQIAPGGGTSSTRIGYLMGSFGNGFTVANLTTGPLIFGVGAGPTERMRITSAGLVGIGTTNPAHTLDVAGDVNLTGCLSYPGVSVGSCPSDQRLKTHIKSLGPVLDRVVQLRPVHFNWKTSNPQGYQFGPERNVGLIAQEVETVFPEMVSRDEKGYRRVDYGQLPYLTLEALRELKARNDSLRGQVTGLQKTAAERESRIVSLEQAAADKDARINAMSREIEQMRKMQEQMALAVAQLNSRLRRNNTMVATKLSK